MARLVIAVYISKFLESITSDGFGPLAIEFRRKLKAGKWPYDVGDDPSFFSAKRLRGPVTWGVCRQDVRNQLTFDTEGQLVQFASNYVIFSTAPSKSVVLKSPPHVAEWRKGDESETWLDTRVASDVRSITFLYASRKNLRTCNRQQPHRHIWAELPIPGKNTGKKWIQNLRQILETQASNRTI